MIGIRDIAYVLGKEPIDTLEHARAIGAPESLVLNKIGVERLHRIGEAEETSDIAAAACEALFRKSEIDPETIECLILVTQNPDRYGLPHTAGKLQPRLGLPERCATFDLSLGCSGYVYALSVATSFMQANGMTRGVIVTADPYSKVIDPADKNTSLLFSDAASATLLTEDPRWVPGKFDFGTDGSQHACLEVTDERKLFMNGRSVFAFSATRVPPSLLRTLELNDVTMDDVDRVVLHQASRFLVETIAKRMKAEDKIAFYSTGYGNTVSSSIPIVLADELSPDDARVLICGFGVGLSWATTLLTRRV